MVEFPSVDTAELLGVKWQIGHGMVYQGYLLTGNRPWNGLFGKRET